MLPSEVTLFGITKDVRPDKAKALSPIVVTLSGILMLLRLVHDSKVRSWIVSIPQFIVIEARLLHPWKAYAPIEVTLEGIVIEVRPEELNAFSPMVVTFSGIVMLWRLLQSINALLPILVTLFGILILVSLSHPLNR